MALATAERTEDVVLSLRMLEGEVDRPSLLGPLVSGTGTGFVFSETEGVMELDDVVEPQV